MYVSRELHESVSHPLFLQDLLARYLLRNALVARSTTWGPVLASFSIARSMTRTLEWDCLLEEERGVVAEEVAPQEPVVPAGDFLIGCLEAELLQGRLEIRSEEHTSELQS